MAVSCPEVMYGAYYPYLYGRGAARSFHHAPHFQYDRLNVQSGGVNAGSSEAFVSGAQSPGSPPHALPAHRLRTKEEDLSAHGRASADVGVVQEAVRPSRRASAAARVRERARSTSAPTASCSRTTPGTSPRSSTSTSPGRSRSTRLKTASRWCRATCRRRSSTRRRWAARAAWSCTSTTRGTSTTPATDTRRTATPPSTTRPPRRTTTWRRRRATGRCCCPAALCTRSTSRWSGAHSTTRRTTSTPPRARPTLIPQYQVWKRRCRTRPRTCTGSERRLSWHAERTSDQCDAAPTGLGAGRACEGLLAALGL
uniref:Uncharacterized protein n=1 Tax=Bombyx mori TaxID=7091 RepID=A0A8R2M717_BOMMO|nr:guanine nucleotide-binding protein G(s) subunit alpha isoforms XLas isoform X1 [Bombyx mori]XP_037875015.1 guanine nucleotide-binding protein G(s) subunit alpha isoforms XLas isoform X1 [Bombyx mori]